MMKEEAFIEETENMQVTTIPQTCDQNILKEFILKFESLPELWDTQNAFYTNKLKRMSALKKLLPIYQRIKPDATIQETRNKINSLRSNYRKELRKVIQSKTALGSDEPPDEVYIPKSWVFYSLQFLNKLDPLVGSTTFSRPEEHEENSVDESETGSFLYISCSRPTTPKRKKEHKPKPEMLDKTCEILSQSHKQIPTKDKIDPTALYWSQKLANLSSNQRVFAEKAINDILFEAELGTLDRHSVQINVSVSMCDGEG